MKTIAARRQCSIPKVVYRYNVMQKDSISAFTAMSNVIYTYNVCIQGINTVPNPEQQDAQGLYRVGDAVSVRIPHSRCTSKSKIGQITRINSLHSVLVDGILHHVKNLHPFPGVHVPFNITSKSSEESEQLSRPGLVSLMMPLTPVSWKLLMTMLMDHLMMVLEEEVPVTQLRRSTRTKRPTPSCTFVMRISEGSVIDGWTSEGSVIVGW